MPGADDDKDKNGKNGKGEDGEGAGADDGGDDSSDDAAGSAGDEGGEGGDFSDPVKALAEIKKLRAENAKHRTKNKSLGDEFGKVKGTLEKLKSALGTGEGEEEEPEKQISKLKEQNQALQIQNAMSDLCREHEIPRKGEKYFNFLIAQEFEGLAEGEEIAEEKILEIAKEAKQMFATSGGQGGGTGVNTDKKKPPGENADAISTAQFVKMNPGEKSALYTKNPNLYTKLFTEAKEKRLF